MADTSSFSEDRRMLVGKNYHFFNRVDHAAPTDFPDYYGYLLSQASVSVKVWDPYFNDGDEDLFGNVQPSVNVTILYMRETFPHRRPSSLDISTVKTLVDARLPLGHGALKVACLPSADVPLYDERKWHDRFLIIDNKILYHIGASLKDLGKKCFAFDLMDSKFIADIMGKV